MNRNLFLFLAAAAAVYSVLVVIKVVGVWKHPDPDSKYEFKTWDGGLLMRGKQIGKQGALVFAIVMIGLTVALVYYATQLRSVPSYY